MKRLKSQSTIRYYLVTRDAISMYSNVLKDEVFRNIIDLFKE